MRRASSLWLVALLGALAPGPAEAQTLPSSDDCRGCHLALDDDRLAAPARAYESDVHAETGFGCLACHGSGGSDRLDAAAGFLAAPSRREVPAMCGRCHSDAAFMRRFDPGMRVDQVQEYWTSRHGELLRDRNDPAVATCIDCHPAHEMRPPDDPSSTVNAANILDTCARCHSDDALMAAREIGTGQVAEYSGSVHGQLLLEEGDLSAPVCNDCHGNHGAAPPGLASVRNVCGQCHTVMADYFDRSAHGRFFEEADQAGCATCHDHHATESVDDASLVQRSEDVCRSCHVAPDTLGLQFQRMAEVLDSLALAEEASRSILDQAENAGMEVSQALFELEDIGNVRTRARSAVHTFRVEDVREEVAAGYALAAQAEERGYEALEEHRVRRIGLGTFAAIVVLLIVGLSLKIREYGDRMEELVAGVEGFYRGALTGRDRRAPSREQIQLAASALMLEVCHADGELSESERAYLERVARRRFRLSPEEAEQLIQLAERERGQPGQLDRIAVMISHHFPLEQKWVLLDELWQLVIVDGEASPEEVAFMERLTHLMGLGGVDSEEAIARGAAAVADAHSETEERT